jgi:hypothetical protein
MQSTNDMRAYVERRLGGGVVHVELTPDHYSDAISESLLWFSGCIGQLKNIVIQVNDSGGAFDVSPDCYQVVEVYFQRLVSDFPTDPFDVGLSQIVLNGVASVGSAGDVYGYGAQTDVFSSIVQSMQYREQARRILSADRDWEWDFAARKLRLFPTSGRLGSEVFAVYLTDEIDVALLRPYEYDVVRRYALGSAMEALGYIRTKYSDGPSATGQVSLNGSDLLANADLIKSDCRDRIARLKPPAPFIVG